jgi:hypothetical protein
MAKNLLNGGQRDAFPECHDIIYRRCGKRNMPRSVVNPRESNSLIDSSGVSRWLENRLR